MIYTLIHHALRHLSASLPGVFRRTYISPHHPSSRLFHAFPRIQISRRRYSMASNLPEIPPVERLSPRVIRILGGNPGKFTLQGTNTYLIGTGPTRLLLDTGEGLRAWRSSLASLLETEHCSISAVLLTHWHGDHVRGAGDVLALCPHATLHKYPGGPADDFPDAHADHPAKPVPETAPIRDGETFATHGATLRAVHSPGHTVDHCGFVLQEEDGALFAGDAVLGHGTAVFEDLTAYVRSLGVLERAVGEKGRIYPGHGAVVEQGKEKVREYIKHREQREREVWEVVRGKGTVTPMEIVKVVYKDYPEALHAAAEGGVRLVLKKLGGDGKVEDVGGKWKVKEGAAL